MASRSFVTILRAAFLCGCLAGLRAQDSIIEDSGFLNSSAVRSMIRRSYIHNSTINVSQSVDAGLVGVVSNFSMVWRSEIYNSMLFGIDQEIGDMKPKEIFSNESSSNFSMNRIKETIIIDSIVGKGILNCRGNSTVDRSWLNRSGVESSNVTSSTVRGSRLCTAEVLGSIVDVSNIIRTSVLSSRVLKSSILHDSDIADSTIINSYIYGSLVSNGKP